MSAANSVSDLRPQEVPNKTGSYALESELFHPFPKKIVNRNHFPFAGRTGSVWLITNSGDQKHTKSKSSVRLLMLTASG